MKQDDLMDLIHSFTQSIFFEYEGRRGMIMPLIAGKNIALCWGEEAMTLKNPAEVMACPIFEGRSFNELSERVEFYNNFNDPA
ncbi:MAG: hypothetical protein LBU36_05900 [Clostridiales bacterium]|jgi:hypothetical protein|nr:hypothetical protein [Clostridiales bacterium]